MVSCASIASVRPSAAARAKDPTFSIPIRALSNVSFNERKGLIEMGDKKQSRTFFNVGMAKKFMQTMLVADALAERGVRDLAWPATPERVWRAIAGR